MWQPIQLHELKALIAQQVVECSPETCALFEANAIAPQKWALSSWGNDGGGFWAIAIIGKTVLWYNDIEEGFNTSSFTHEGTIEQYWCNQDTLHEAMLGLTPNAPKLGAPDAPA
ncbi:hypothetical protein [Pseudomonas sp. F(2018)]|uniref:hypothetical protein n=1 Tax=Pseudomonas sp. F(2018) TaxID=2502240 RepID=UPI001C49AE9E|nr:hypothetical protein [Pseudomonas sp. F(2018)]